MPPAQRQKPEPVAQSETTPVTFSNCGVIPETGQQTPPATHVSPKGVQPVGLVVGNAVGLFVGAAVG